MSRIRRLAHTTRDAVLNFRLKPYKHDTPVKSHNTDTDENIKQLSKDSIWTNIFDTLLILKKYNIISDSYVKLYKDEKKINVGIASFSVTAENADHLFIGIINQMFLIHNACWFSCSDKIKEQLSQLNNIASKHELRVGILEIVTLNKIYSLFLQLCIQFCDENEIKYKNRKEFDIAENHAKASTEIKKIKTLSTGGKNKRKKEKTTNKTKKQNKRKEKKTRKVSLVKKKNVLGKQRNIYKFVGNKKEYIKYKNKFVLLKKYKEIHKKKTKAKKT